MLAAFGTGSVFAAHHIVTASLVHAYANWVAAVVPPAALAAAILTRRNLSLLLWGSLALGIAGQIVLIGADAFATRIRLPFLAKPNPYYRTLGWSAYGRTVGQLARKLRILALRATPVPKSLPCSITGAIN